MTKSAELRTSSSLPAQPRTNRYLLSWMALAAFGIGYIGFASIRPDLLAGVLPLADQNAEQAYGGRNAADLADELITLRKWVNDLQHEMAATKSAVQVQAEQGKSLQQRLSAAEERLPPGPCTETPMYLAPSAFILARSSLMVGEWPSEDADAALLA